MTADKKHIFLTDSASPFQYSNPTPPRGITKYPSRNHDGHGAFVEYRLHQAWKEVQQQRETQTAIAVPTRHGTYLEFESAQGFEFNLDNLESKPNGIRVMNVRKEPPVLAPAGEKNGFITKATVYIPAGKEGHFLKKVQQYQKDITKQGKPQNEAFINCVENIHVAMSEAFWVGGRELCPGGVPVACEVWLHGNGKEVEVNFRSLAWSLDIPLETGSLIFPELTVVLAHANRKQLGQLVARCDNLAEFRRAKETAEFWTGMNNADQTTWMESLMERLTVSLDADVAVSVLDTGANNGHPLLSRLLEDKDRHACDPQWGVHDHDGHGTLMCGLAGYGNLQQALEGTGALHVEHCLESVKILPSKGQNAPTLYGYVTSQAASRVEIPTPERKRVFCLAVTSKDNLDKGRPTSWSAALDALASGLPICKLAPGAETLDRDHASENGKRLIIVAAGNVEDPNQWKSYPNCLLHNSAHDPAQSWNALTVGAYTRKTYLADSDLKGYRAVAPAGGLSPYTTTSVDWDRKWPTKPDIVMEGGNVVREPGGLCTSCDDTSLLSLCHEPTLRQFDCIQATSAAAAQAAWMAARIQTAYPQAWPETVRGLMVHSSWWTDKMESLYRDEKGVNYKGLLQVCGYGVPDLDRALRCASNRLTLIAQDTLQPFEKKKSEYRTKDMNVHELPWPRKALFDLGGQELTMRITLSYFIEPGPGEKGWASRYRYASHALRFDLNNPGESASEFQKRLSKAYWEEGEKAGTKSDTDRWHIGPMGRSRGSLHSDIWTGSAAELAACNLVGVYPVIGWWRERAWLGCWNKQARYSLIVSLHAPELKVDIYTPVAVEVGAMVTVST